MGLFRKTTDDWTADPQQDVPAQPDPQQALPAPSVDGVLPPGMSPQPAPASHNLSSQTSTPSVDDILQQVDASLQQAGQPFDDPAANDAGDYIMSDPPMQPAEPSAETAPAEHIEPSAPEPAYEEVPVASEPSFTEATQEEPEAITEPEPVFTEATESMPESQPQNEQVSEAEPMTEAVNVGSDVVLEQPAEFSLPSATRADNVQQDLADIKLQALQQLSSIAGHLEQSPEEKFHTTMMMLQATDDQSLIKTAYDAAQAITDEKTRAQALLDVVNEINYFSQKSNG